MNVVAVDAGPAKGGTVFDGEFKSIVATDLPAYCQTLSQQGPVLLCWDAPLTGPPFCRFHLCIPLRRSIAQKIVLSKFILLSLCGCGAKTISRLPKTMSGFTKMPKIIRMQLAIYGRFCCENGKTLARRVSAL